jgi:lysyl-tRNA synthetase class 2
MMDFTEGIMERVALALHDTTLVQSGDKMIDYKRPYPRVTMYQAIKEHTGYDIAGKTEQELREICDKLSVANDPSMGKGKLIDEIFGEKCEHHYIQPTFITDYPVEMSPLTKKHRNNPELTERFELMVNGKELANAYSELNDPVDQRERFEDQLRLLEKGDDEAMFIDQDFLRALEYGMPPTSGMGIGIDRLTMFMTNSSSIQDVLFFPQMKPEKKADVDPDEKFEALGIPAQWVYVIKKMGFRTVEALKEVKAGKFFNDLCGLNKKNKLGLQNPTMEEVVQWLA